MLVFYKSASISVAYMEEYFHIHFMFITVITLSDYLKWQHSAYTMEVQMYSCSLFGMC